MSFTQAVRSAFAKYADFNGRARLSEFWWFALFHFLINLVLGAVALAVFLAVAASGDPAQALLNPMVVGMLILLGVIDLALLLPYLAVWGRRLHDSGQSAVWLLLLLIPIGQLVLLVMAVMPGTLGANRYGPDPTEVPEPGV